MNQQICYIHVISSESSTTNKPTANSTKEKSKASTKNTDSNTAKTKEKNKAFTKNTSDGTKSKSKLPTKDTNGRTVTKDKIKVDMKDAKDRASTTKAKKALNSQLNILFL